MANPDSDPKRSNGRYVGRHRLTAASRFDSGVKYRFRGGAFTTTPDTELASASVDDGGVVDHGR